MYFVEPKMTIFCDEFCRSTFQNNHQIHPGYQPGNGSKAFITGYPPVLDLNYPNLSQIGDSAETQLVVDYTNSNLADVIAISPKYFYYDLSVLSNPDIKVHDNFITDQSRIGVYQNL